MSLPVPAVLPLWLSSGPAVREWFTAWSLLPRRRPFALRWMGGFASPQRWAGLSRTCRTVDDPRWGPSKTPRPVARQKGQLWCGTGLTSQPRPRPATAHR